MITRLYLNSCFTHQDKTFDFENGLTGIIGANESGKSLIVEMIRFALFGTKALRGAADDYKKLHVELDFVVQGLNHTVIRKGAKVQLVAEGNVVATATKPVNEAIQRLLGYDLNVFDVANVCNQGDVEALSNMTPTARKAMVDKTVGLNVLDELIKFCGQEGNALKREADAINSTLVDPVEPVLPEGYRVSSEIQPEINDATREVDEFNQLKGKLSNAPEEPKKPAKCSVKETADELQAIQDQRRGVERSIVHMKAELAGIKPEVHTEAELAEFEGWMDQADKWKIKKRLLDQGHQCCPECDHSWPLAGDDLAPYADVEETVAPSMTRAQLASYRSLIGNNDKRTALEQAIFEVEEGYAEMPDRSADLRTRQDYDSSAAAYARQMVAFDTFNEGLAERQARLEELTGCEAKLSSLHTELAQATQYEREITRFTNDLQRMHTLAEQGALLDEKSKEFLKAREIIQALKISVKNHLLPSLNAVASTLLSRMTGGERYEVVVDEDFDIMIDGQAINTLSGSGKAVANLSIRIALGQILTNRVFSVFMADEVDAAMDDERASYTAQALRRLTETITQVIQVTHKHPETDHTFELKKCKHSPKPAGVPY